MKDINLTTQWSATGRDIETFFESLRKLDEITLVEKVASQDVQLYSIINDEHNAFETAVFCYDAPMNLMCSNVQQGVSEASEQNKLKCVCFTSQKTPTLGTFSVETLKEKGVTDNLLYELNTDSKLMLRYNNRSYIVSPLALTSLNQRAAIGGEVFSKPSVSQAEEIFKSFQKRYPQILTMVTRQIQDTEVLFAAHSNAYTHIPQSTLIELYNKITADFGNAKCREWYVNHTISGCFIEFPEMGEDMSKLYKLPHICVPGLYIATSDTGDCSLTISAYWNFNGKILLGESNKLLHRGALSIDKFVQQSKNKVYGKYNTVPERLCELLAIDVENPVETLKDVFKQIGISKVIGKKRSKYLTSAMSAEFISGMKYTAYDIATAITDVTERISGLSRPYKDMLSATVTKAVFADYSKATKEEITLI